MMAIRQEAARCSFRNKKLDFDSIAFCGMSGALFAPMLAKELNKELILVRKMSDTNGGGKIVNHSGYTVEGHAASLRYVIVDDQCSMGSTVRHIITKIKEFAPDAVCVGIYEYIDAGFMLMDESDYRLKPLYLEGGALYSDASKSPTIALADDPTVDRACGCVTGQGCIDCCPSIAAQYSLAVVLPPSDSPGAIDASKSEAPFLMSEVSDDPLGDSF